jgi:proline iminopeptidase
MEGIWGFHLRPLPDGGTRLVISGYQAFRPRWIERFIASWVLLPVSWPMQVRMMAVLKRNVEHAVASSATHPVTSGRSVPAG